MTAFDLTMEMVGPILTEYGFKVIERFNNYVRLESPKVAIIIAYDEREKTGSVFVGERNSDLDLLHRENIRDIFDYAIEHPRGNDFLTDFLKDKGKGILTGDLLKLRELDKYERKRSKIYTDNIVNGQNIRDADKAWNEKDYLNFIKTIDKVDKSSLPGSYKLKHRIAWNKIRGIN